MADEEESELALVNQRVIELEQDVIKFKSQVAMLEKALESKHMEDICVTKRKDRCNCFT